MMVGCNVCAARCESQIGDKMSGAANPDDH